ncbi:MAG: hypothetical protein FWH53_02300 [Leptospirales bacterium]|nr:hypothetical protein [Leptospirales bacterium]
MYKKYLIPIMLIAYLASCGNEKMKTINKLREEPVYRLESYDKNLDVTLKDRVFDAPPFVIDYLKKLDKTDKYKPYTISQSDKYEIEKCIAGLPKKIKDVLNIKLLGIFFVDEFMGGGLTEYVFDIKGNLYSIIILNPKILKTSMSDWINYRDNSIFNETDGITVKSICKPNNLQLLQTIVHEISHVYDYHVHITPYTDAELTIFKTSDISPFIDNVWENYYKPVKEYDFPQRDHMSFYGFGDKKIDSLYAAELYKDLLNTPFSSLYGSISWGEDFAESFTWFYLNKLFGIEYTVNVYRDKILLISFSPLKIKKIEQRIRILEELID